MTDVKSFWEDRAADPSLDDSQVTHPDVWQRWLEIQLVKRQLRSGDRALDVGCGAGYATRQFAPLVQEIVGVDFSAGMITRALGPEPPAANTRFLVGDVLELDPEVLGLFDVVISIRCLINLPGWNAQRRALERLAAVLRPGGRLVLAEGSADGREGLNRLREATGLERMPSVWHNCDFCEEHLLAEVAREFVIGERSPLGMYDFVARVVHPLLVAPEKPQYDTRINQIAAQVALARAGLPEISRVLFLVLTKRGLSTSDRDGNPAPA